MREPLNAFLHVFKDEAGREIALFEAYFQEGFPMIPPAPAKSRMQHPFRKLKVYSRTIKTEQAGPLLKVTGLCRVPKLAKPACKTVTGTPEMARHFIEEVAGLPHRKLTYRCLLRPSVGEAS